MSGWACSWKNAQGIFFVVPWLWLRSLSDSTMDFYSSKRWESVLWYNLHKELKGIKEFFKKKPFFLYLIRHKYQSKTCVEHIEQVVDKSLINSTNSSMNLLYFLHMRVICFRYCKKCMRSQIRKFWLFWSNLWTCQV